MKNWKLGITLILCLGLLASCAYSSLSKKVNPDLNPEQTVEAAFNSLQEKDYKTFDRFINESNEIFISGYETKEDNLILNEMFKKLTYKIEKTSTEKDSATVRVTLTNTDFSEVVKEMVHKSLESALKENKDIDAENLFVKLLAKANKSNKTISSNLDLELVKTNEGWKIKLNKQAEDILIGHMGDFLG